MDIQSILSFAAGLVTVAVLVFYLGYKGYYKTARTLVFSVPLAFAVRFFLYDIGDTVFYRSPALEPTINFAGSCFVFVYVWFLIGADTRQNQ